QNLDRRPPVATQPDRRTNDTPDLEQSLGVTLLGLDCALELRRDTLKERWSRGSGFCGERSDAVGAGIPHRGAGTQQDNTRYTLPPAKRRHGDSGVQVQAAGAPRLLV